MSSTTEAKFLNDVRVVNGKIVPASTWFVLTRGGARVLSGLLLLVLGIVFVFAHPIIGGVLIVLALVAFSQARPQGMFTGWHGSCPACAAELWLPQAKDAPPVQGHDCPICQNRIILRNQHFEIAPAPNK
jgi:hypothetical protein